MKEENYKGYTLDYETHFSSAHSLADCDVLKTKKCTRVHGHRWRVKVEIKSFILVGGMITDFKNIKEVVDRYDHRNLNDLVEFNPTAENLSRKLQEDIAKLEPNEAEWRVKVTIWESPKSSVSYGILS